MKIKELTAEKLYEHYCFCRHQVDSFRLPSWKHLTKNKQRAWQYLCVDIKNQYDNLRNLLIKHADKY